MPLRLFATLLTSSLLVCLASASAAQTSDRPTPQLLAQTAGTANDLRLTPRVSADLNTPRNGDSDRGFTQVNGFIPLFQTPGSSVTFLQTTARIDTGGDWGGSVSLGHRFDLDTLILGGYLAYDIRDTGSHTFNQLGFGLELFGDAWDAHLNAYLPVGDTSAQIGGAVPANQVTGSFFQGNQLFFTTGGLQQVETALGGVDLEAGLRLASLSNSQLWGYGSVYTLGDAIGGSLRLDHRIGNTFRLGAGVQSDGIFGTQAFFSIGASLGGSRPSGDTPDAPRWAQAGENITRNSSIAVEQTTQGTAAATLVAINPATGQPYVIRFVTPDAASPNQGSGTVESPFTTLGTGSTGPASTGLGSVGTGEIVYVRVGDSRTTALAPFTVPANVQVYSEAVAQTLTTQFGDVALPGSGSGQRPLVNGGGTSNGITLAGGNNSISGFEVSNAVNGISLNNPSGTVVVSDTIVRNSTNRAVSLAQNSGQANVTLQNSTFTNSANDGVRAELTGTANLTLTLSNTQISTVSSADGDGIDIEANDSSIANLRLANNQISNAGNSGIELETCGNSTTSSCNASFSATVVDNTISNSGGDGVVFLHNSNQAAQLTLDSNQISQSGTSTNGISRNPINPLPINGNGGFGIVVVTLADGNLALAITDNTIINSRDEKIAVINNFASSVATPAAPTVNAAISGNTTTGTGTGIVAGNDVSVFTANGGAVCLGLQNNTAANGYFFLNGVTTSPIPVFTVPPGTFARSTFAGNTGSIVTSGTIPPGFTVQSAAPTAGTCTLP